MEHPIIQWIEDGKPRSARWRSESGVPPPTRVEVVDDRITADAAYGLATQGVALLWRGDFQNARQLLTALASRADRHPRKRTAPKPVFPDAFHAHRQAQAQRARTLSRLLLPFESDYSIALRRAPDLREACLDAYGPGGAPSVASLRDLQGMVGAHEWRKKGIPIPEAGGSIHPHYGIFAPVRREYIGLVATAPLPEALKDGAVAFDIGTGTGVLAAVLAKRGVAHVVATDTDPRAIACARDNVARLGFAGRVEVVDANLFPPGRAGLVVCNPPWIPARPSSPVEHGIYDPESAMLRGFLDGLAEHLVPGGEGWLILSDLAEHLKLRSREELLAMFGAAGLVVVDRMDTRPKHPKASDSRDPLHAARGAEVTSLWRLAARS